MKHTLLDIRKISLPYWLSYENLALKVLNKNIDKANLK